MRQKEREKGREGERERERVALISPNTSLTGRGGSFLHLPLPSSETSSEHVIRAYRIFGKISHFRADKKY